MDCSVPEDISDLRIRQDPLHVGEQVRQFLSQEGPAVARITEAVAPDYCSSVLGSCFHNNGSEWHFVNQVQKTVRPASPSFRRFGCTTYCHTIAESCLHFLHMSKLCNIRNVFLSYAYVDTLFSFKYFHGFSVMTGACLTDITTVLYCTLGFGLLYRPVLDQRVVETCTITIIHFHDA